VDLVEDLSRAEPDSDVLEASCAAGATLVDYCGFLDLEGAREARDRLRLERIRSEILIREADASTMDRPIKEEYWLRVERNRFRACSEILGYDSVKSVEPESFSCSSCGNIVSEHESACPKCGAGFEDD
jgi:hypothetical protein